MYMDNGGGGERRGHTKSKEDTERESTSLALGE